MSAESKSGGVLHKLRERVLNARDPASAPAADSALRAASPDPMLREPFDGETPPQAWRRRREWTRIQFLEATNAWLRRRVSELERQAAQALFSAYHDELTGLPNRRLFFDRLGMAIEQASRTGSWVILLLCDLDEFKRINDELGHVAGDQLLRQCAQRLTGAIRGADTAARYGGDEFVIMLPEVQACEERELRARIDTVTDKILGAMAAPFALDEHSLRVALSIGSAVFPHDGKNAEELLRRADAGMYLAKARNKNPQPPPDRGRPESGTVQ